MILPYLRGIRSFIESPVTWILFFLNLAVMIYSFQSYVSGQKEIQEAYNDEVFLTRQGEFYSQYILFNKSLYSDSTLELVDKAYSENEAIKFSVLGSLAVRDRAFLNQVNNFSFEGDEVALNWWKDKLEKLKGTQMSMPSYILGLSSEDLSLSKWLTYQFVHSGLMHFLGNMLFLLIFGCMIEPIIGGLAMLIIYLASGMLAAGVFLYFSGVSSIPLIGASGAVSGIMALFCLMFWTKPVRYIYFLFIPKRGFAGMVYLPGWVTFVMWVFADLGGYLGTLNEFGGVAHAAHLGGEFAGVLVALTVFGYRKLLNKELIPPEKMPETYPVGTRVA